MQNSRISYRSGVLVGNIGVGKTRLLNFLCGTSIKTCSNQNTDLDIHVRQTIGVPLTLSEIPGIDINEEEGPRNDYEFYYALSLTRINGIFMVLKYESRHFKIIRQFQELSNKLSEIDAKHFYVIVTHWDRATDQQSEREVIIQKLKEEDVPQHKIFFFDPYNNEDCPATRLYGCLKNTEKFEIKLSEDDFIFGVTKTVREKRRTILDEFNNEAGKTFRSYQVLADSNQINQLRSQQEKVIQFNNLTENFQKELQQKLDSMATRYKCSLDELAWFYLCGMLKKQSIIQRERYMEFLESGADDREIRVSDCKIQEYHVKCYQQYDSRSIKNFIDYQKTLTLSDRSEKKQSISSGDEIRTKESDKLSKKKPGKFDCIKRYLSLIFFFRDCFS